MRDRFYIAIEGVIGVGKTTLARLVKERLQAQLLLEIFEENPFLSDFYSDRARYAFQTELFFLLSRYRLQHSVIRKTLEQQSLVSDFSFSKASVFAPLNLAGDELDMYTRVHTILAQTIPTPDLVVFLRADTDVLMQRIVTRDRLYERNMSRQYIEDLRVAYERFFAGYSDSPVLSIDTNQINIVSNPEDVDAVFSQIRAAVEKRAYQPQLPSLDARSAGRPAAMQEIDVEAWTAAAQQPDERSVGADEKMDDLYFGYLRLTQEIGQVGAQIARIWSNEHEYARQVGNRIEARERALGESLPELQEGLLNSLQRLTDMARLLNGHMNGLPPASGRQ